MYGVLFQTEAQLSLKNAGLPSIFFLDTKSICLVLFSLLSFRPRKNILASVSIAHTNLECLEMHRTYAQ